jgi:hypothetical protein
MMSLPLTEELRQALSAEHGGAVQIVDQQTNRVYYLIPAEQFETYRAMVDTDEFQPRDLYPLISKTAASAGWDDPRMDEYDSYDEHRRDG